MAWRTGRTHVITACVSILRGIKRTLLDVAITRVSIDVPRHFISAGKSFELYLTTQFNVHVLICYY